MFLITPDCLFSSFGTKIKTFKNRKYVPHSHPFFARFVDQITYSNTHELYRFYLIKKDPLFAERNFNPNHTLKYQRDKKI